MRFTALRRGGLAASAATLALLATACGDSSDDGDKGADAKALTAAELEKAALAQADVDNGEVHGVTETDADRNDQVTSDDAACAPLALILAHAPLGEPVATEKRRWKEEGKKPSGSDAMTGEELLAYQDTEMASVMLASYEDGGAETVLKDTKAALEKCADGFAYTAYAETTEVVKVTETEAPKNADEAIAMTATSAIKDVEVPNKVVVARQGSTVVTFDVENIVATAMGEDFEFPTQVFDTQLGKLG